MSNTSKPKTQLDLEKLSKEELLSLAQSLDVLDDRKKYNKQDFLFDECLKKGYKKQLIFFKAGAIYRERALIAGNRTGKTYTAETEVSYHANGRYPKGWEGRKFDHPTIIWEAGKTHETTRDILQKYLLGPKHEMGTGFLPRDDIYWGGKFQVTSKSGIPDAIQDVYIKHYTNGVFDGYSEIHFKSYVQGVEAFMGAQVHVVHLDEEPDKREIYSECVTRTMTTNGIILCTFTPLLGLSEVVLSFLPGGKFPPGGIGAVDDEQ